MIKLLEQLKIIAKEQDFNPQFIGIFLNPFWIARRGLREAITIQSKSLSGRLLDVGYGTKPYIGLFSCTEYIGLEYASERALKAGIADYYYNGDLFPFPDNSFDSLLCSQVLEHVFYPEKFISEMYRVLKAGGKLLLTVPFFWDEHEQPLDYARYTSYGMITLLTSQGFEIVEQRKCVADISAIAQLANAYIYKILPKNRLLRRMIIAVVMSTITVSGICTAKLLPKNSDFYLDQAIIARKAI